jgi:hypothetical protein
MAVPFLSFPFSFQVPKTTMIPSYFDRESKRKSDELALRQQQMPSISISQMRILLCEDPKFETN